jgi:hypothetical protein
VLKITKVLLLNTVLVLLIFNSALAHHTMGNPRFVYKDSHPEAPTLEYPAELFSYDIVFTSYPGRPNIKEPTSFSFYAKDRETNKQYQEPITIRVLKNMNFGGTREVLKPTLLGHRTQPYTYDFIFTEDGDYVIEMIMVLKGKDEMIPFIITAGKPSITIPALIAVGVILTLYVFIILISRIRRTRKKKQISFFLVSLR